MGPRMPGLYTMIVVRVELHSAIDKSVTEIARMFINNDGTGNADYGNYNAMTYRGRDTDTLDQKSVTKSTHIDNYPHQWLHVWNLVTRALVKMGYK